MVARTHSRRLASLLTLALALGSTALLGPACAGSQAHLEWRAGLSANDFDGLFELSRDEYQDFADQALPNTVLDRRRGEARAEAGAIMAELGARLAGAGQADPHGYAITALSAEGQVSLTAGQGKVVAGEVDWLAATADRGWAALLSGSKLAVVYDGASTGIDLGSLLGGAVASHRFMMLVRDGELTVFALPEIGGAVTANEPGYVLSFNYRPTTKQVWEVSVARVSVAM